MKIKDIISRVNKSKQFEDKIYVGDMASKMDLNIETSNAYDDQDRLTSYFFGGWYCTDSWVGYKVYFFDGEPVAVSSQTGRKMPEDIEWLSKEAFKKVKDYVMTFEQKREDNIALCDMNDEIGDSYKINFHSQLFDYHRNIALHNGLKVKIVECHKGNSTNKDGQYQPSLVKIQFEDETDKWVELGKLDFPFNLRKIETK